MFVLVSVAVPATMRMPPPFCQLVPQAPAAVLERMRQLVMAIVPPLPWPM